LSGSGLLGKREPGQDQRAQNGKNVLQLHNLAGLKERRIAEPGVDVYELLGHITYFFFYETAKYLKPSWMTDRGFSV
jgi:hypothetical protein